MSDRHVLVREIKEDGREVVRSLCSGPWVDITDLTPYISLCTCKICKNIAVSIIPGK